MAHKKAGGSTSNGRDSNAKRRGVKLFGGQLARPGNIIVRQKGTRWFPGQGVSMGKDFTIFATEEGKVTFTIKRQQKFNGQTHYDTIVNVFADAPVKAAPKVKKTTKKVEKKPETAKKAEKKEETAKKEDKVKEIKEEVTA